MPFKNFTITNSSVDTNKTINDLGNIVVPFGDTINLFPENFTMEQIRDSLDLRALIDTDLDITATFGVTSITTGLEFDAQVFDFNKEEIDAIEGEQTITHVVGSQRATIEQDLERSKDGTTTAETPFIAPFTNSYLRIAIIASKQDDPQTYDIKVLVNDTIVKTFSVTANDRIVDSAVTGVAASLNDEIRYRIEKNGATAFNVRKLEAEFVWSSKSS